MTPNPRTSFKERQRKHFFEAILAALHLLRGLVRRSRQELVLSSSAKKGACPMEDETPIGHTPGGDINRPSHNCRASPPPQHSRVCTLMYSSDAVVHYRQDDKSDKRVVAIHNLMHQRTLLFRRLEVTESMRPFFIQRHLRRGKATERDRERKRGGDDQGFPDGIGKGGRQSQVQRLGKNELKEFQAGFAVEKNELIKDYQNYPFDKEDAIVSGPAYGDKDSDVVGPSNGGEAGVFRLAFASALDDSPGCGHAYLHWDNCIHPVGENEGSVPCWSSGRCSFVINYNRLWDSEPIDDVFPNKLGNILIFDVGISFFFYSFVEVVGGYEQEFFLSNSNRQGANYFHLP
ncbi:hypothetical protein CK203_058096 [Vitis vinifera]|uniref:Uncharacterized protein n=1 Tax=Vitis vinifera TaxID=29760 RepID=A0A438GGT4_VITVI|nr:hypothetical protein CK203_058096 [Vitis vinifera]